MNEQQFTVDEMREIAVILARRVAILEQLFDLATFDRIEDKDMTRLGFLLLLEPYTEADVEKSMLAKYLVDDVRRKIE